eukprot:11216841-Lingulodinium_polyedra.AAC.1
MHLARLVRENGGLYALEHPRDPSPLYPSLWATPCLQEWFADTQAHLHFDQCRFGQGVAKPTTLAVSDVLLDRLQDLR